MKKTITTIGLTLATVSLSFASDFLEVTSLRVVDNKTIAEVRRFSTEASQDSFTGGYVFEGNISMQDVVTKMSYKADENITVIAKNASSTKGQVNTLAKLRSNAYSTKGLIGYFTELARQQNLEK